MDFKVLEILALSLTPAFEGRYAVIAGVTLGLSIKYSALIASIGVIILSTTLPLLLARIDEFLRRNSSLKLASNLYTKYVCNVRRRVERIVDKYGFIGLTLFVAIPLPATGVWTGCLAGLILGVETKRLMLALVLGGMLSILITTLTYTTTKTLLN